MFPYCERSIINAIKSELPGIKLLYCWNHIFRDVQVWCRKHGAPKSDVSVYTEDLRLLFHSSSEETYMQKLSDYEEGMGFNIRRLFYERNSTRSSYLYWPLDSGEVFSI